MKTVDCVIGSGPSGIAAAAALLAAGRRVLMVDAGHRIEPDRAAAVDAYLDAPEGSGEAPWLAESDAEATRKIPRKLLFGSDFPFRGASEHLHVDSDGVGLQPSLAVGGLSNVWGAAMLPYTAEDTRDWPVSAAELVPHYQASLRLTGISARDDDLAAMLPLHTKVNGVLESSAQARSVLSVLDRNRETLRGQGVHYGSARVAVDTSADGNCCTYCGMCLSGCPRDLIYSTARTLAGFRRDPNFAYETDIIIESVSEAAGEAVARGYRRTTGEPVGITAERLFLAAGVIPTSRILLQSRDLIDHTVLIRDSQYFLLPVALNAGVADVRDERLHALSQLFLEISDPQISPHLVHLQVYSYNRLIGAKIAATLGPAARAVPRLARFMENRLMLIQGYLHSDHSSAVAATLRPGGRFELRPVINPEAAARVGRVARKLLALRRRIGLTPIPPLREVAEPGRGFHSGGSFPMRAKPGPGESDVLGRPFGWRRIHAVDATVLPSIPATTITLPVMANAHRIASIAPAEPS